VALAALVEFVLRLAQGFIEGEGHLHQTRTEKPAVMVMWAAICQACGAQVFQGAQSVVGSAFSGGGHLFQQHPPELVAGQGKQDTQNALDLF
ncbi:hypothetical protein, partial [Pseudomonas aeruginosa]|uniref:hypothetical protein n=1 Tax=Pseudomonas aeruginosa TaxID=287 RepID=UPI003CE8E200